MDPKFLPTDLNGKMDHVFEEKAELDEALGSLLRWASKARRFGWESKSPKGELDGSTNQQAVRQLLPKAIAETEDLLAALNRLQLELD